MAVEKITPQLVKKGKGKKRPGYRGDGEYQGGRGYGGSKSSKGGDKGTGGSKGNLGGGGGGQDSNYRRYSPPTKKTYTSKTIDSKPVTGKDYRDSRNDFVNTLNRNNQITAERNNTRFIPYQGGARTSSYYNPNPLSNLFKLAAGIAIPGASFFLNKGSKLKDGIMNINDSIQNSDFGRSTSLMDYLDMKKFGGYNEREMARRINMDEAKNLQARIDGGEFGDFGIQTPKAKPTFSDPFRNTVGTTTKVNASASDAVSSTVPQDLDEIGKGAGYVGYDKNELAAIAAGTKTPKLGDLTSFIEPLATITARERELKNYFDSPIQPKEGIMEMISESLFPEGNLQDIIKNSKTQKDYNINATKDLVENLPGGVVKEAIAPAVALGMSPFYDGIQAATRMTEADIDRAMQTGALTPREIASEAYGLAFDRENPLSSAIERFTGAAAPLAERFANLNLSNPFISEAAAAEVRPAIKAKDTGLGFSVPTGDVGLNASGRLGNLSATVDAIDALKGQSVDPQINYSGNFGNTNVYGNYSDDVQNLGLNFNNDKGLSGGISYDAITGEPRFDIGFRRTFADGGLASMFTRRG